MTSRRVATKPQDETAVAAKPTGHTEGFVLAAVATDPEFQAAIALKTLQAPLFPDRVLSVTDVVDVLRRRVKRVNDNDLSNVEATLVAQAQTLDAVFNNLLMRCTREQGLQSWEANMRAALRAQNQCRMTLETLATIKNPPVVFARQANINNGGQQQVNNGAQPVTRPRGAASEPIGLLEDQGERMDTGASGATGGADPIVAPMGEVDRTDNGRGKGPRVAQRLEGREPRVVARIAPRSARAARGADVAVVARQPRRG
ncbi:hypothetical protein [Aquabacterium sp.]|uniref:hypothetical protein n=1 Tax=Aquabacterium sp. TaxID=1872578 RepID=UPI0037834270